MKKRTHYESCGESLDDLILAMNVAKSIYEEEMDDNNIHSFLMRLETYRQK